MQNGWVFYVLFYGQPIFIKSDHKLVEAIIRKPISSTPARVQRFLVRLMKYDVRIEFVLGKFLHIADTLSRAHSLLIFCSPLNTSAYSLIKLSVSGVVVILWTLIALKSWHVLSPSKGLAYFVSTMKNSQVKFFFGRDNTRLHLTLHQCYFHYKL